MGLRLIKCPRCQKNVLDNTTNCPHCGAPLSGFNISASNIPINQQEKLKGIKIVRIGLLVGVIAWFILMFSGLENFGGLFFFIIIVLFFVKSVRSMGVSAKSK